MMPAAVPTKGSCPAIPAGVFCRTMAKKKEPLPPATAPAAVMLLRPFQSFFQLESAGSILLLACAVLALLWANSPFAESYFHLWEQELTIGLVDGPGLTKTLHHWINDGLMVVFFFVIGLEIKREVLIGELSSASKAGLPLAAALGGMVVPASVYAVLNAGEPTLHGWGIPMATDIAFALGILALLGSRAPLGLKIFLTALAIVDDLGAVLVIALFYTADVSFGSLGIAAGFLLAMFLLNALGVRHAIAYLIFGIGVWIAVLQSGVHATVAGVLAAMAIPASSRIDAPQFLSQARAYLHEFEEDVGPDNELPSSDQRDAVYSLESAAEALLSPLARLEHLLHPWVAYVVIPVFALANAGVALSGGALDAVSGSLGLGVILGLVLGKQVGVMLFAWLAVKLGFATLPGEASWKQLYGVACLCGIGFTMSLFIGDLAFTEPEMLDAAKTAILVASVVAGLWGWIVLSRTSTPDH
jgi:NhaA family Na+:H+ antiporter